MSDNPKPTGLPALRRRDFLALGGATLAVTGLPSVASAARAAASPLGIALDRGAALSVGYLAGSDAWVDSPDLPWDYTPGSERAEFEIEVVPAAAMTVGSELALRPIELTVHGLVPGLPERGTAAWKSAYFFASLPAPPDMPFGPDPVPFLAWSARADGDPRQAAKVRPMLQTGVDGSFWVGLEVRDASRTGRRNAAEDSARDAGIAAPSTTLRSANFTVDGGGGRPALTAGVYLLAFAPGLWDRTWRGTLGDLASTPGLESVAIGILPLD